MGEKKGNGFFSALCFIVIMVTATNFTYNKGKNKAQSDTNNDSYSIVNIDDNTLNILKDYIGVNLTDGNKDELYLFNSIYNNKNLNQDQKNVFYGFYSVVDDIVNINKDLAYDSFSKVTVNYVERDKDVLENVLGDYDYNTCRINIYTDDKDNKVLLHEGIHCLLYNSKSVNLPRALIEGMTELITNEYFSDVPFYEGSTYPLEISYVKMLCELVGTDIVLDACTSGNYSLIYREMDKYNKSDFSSYKVLDIYEDALYNIDNLGSSYYSNEDRRKAYNIIGDIYNNRGDNSNSVEFNYLHELSSACFEEDATGFFSEYIFYYGILEKAYVSNYLKKEFPNPVIVPEKDKSHVLVLNNNKK